MENQSNLHSFAWIQFWHGSPKSATTPFISCSRKTLMCCKAQSIAFSLSISAHLPYKSKNTRLAYHYEIKFSNLTPSTLATACKLSSVGLDLFHLLIEPLLSLASFSTIETGIPLSRHILFILSYSNLSLLQKFRKYSN